MKPLPPSRPPKSPPNPASSTISWTIPKPTDVLSYVYLWAREAAEGRDEGSKERPVVVVIATEKREDETELLVAPVTTRPPRTSTRTQPLGRIQDEAVEISKE